VIKNEKVGINHILAIYLLTEIFEVSNNVISIKNNIKSFFTSNVETEATTNTISPKILILASTLCKKPLVLGSKLKKF